MAGGIVRLADVVMLTVLAILAIDDLHGTIPRGMVLIVIVAAIVQQLLIIGWRHRVRWISDEVRELSESVSQISRWWGS